MAADGTCFSLSGSVSANVNTSVSGWAPNVNLPPSVIPTFTKYAGAANAVANDPKAYGIQLLSQYGQQYSSQYAAQYGAQYSAQIGQAAQYINTGAVQALWAGAQAAANGQKISKEQIEGGFMAAATAAAVIGGAQVPVAGPFIALAALLVFGGGELVEKAMRAIFGPDSTPISCSDRDKSLYGSDPSDPNWRPYGVGQEQWLPISDGAFERWARPILISTFEKVQNCKPVPGIVRDDPSSFCRFYAGMIASWNAMFPGAPRRTVDPASIFLRSFKNLKYEKLMCPGTDCLTRIPDNKWTSANWVPKDPGWRMQQRYANDPIAVMSAALYRCPELTGMIPPATKYDAQFILSEFLPLSVAVPQTTVQKVLKIAVPAVAVAPFAYAWLTGKSVESVLSSAWRSTLSILR